MPNFVSFSALLKEAEKMGKELENAEKRKITHAQAERGQKIIDSEFSSDLGSDRAFSGWRRGSPMPADTQIKTTRNNGAVLMPTRSGAGIITTADQGRHHGDAGGFAGPGINRRTGVTSRTKSGALRKVRATRSRKWNGTTAGKHTASRAVTRMERELPKIAEDGIRRVMRKHFDVT